MNGFDVVVIGAGPAGGHCARLLAKAGYQILLVEQHESFERNNYSSAGSPLETLEQFHLPDAVVASYWQKLVIISTNVRRSWESPVNLGVVFDFAKLREFLAKETQQYGGQVWLGCRYLNYQQEAGNTLVFLKNRHGDRLTVKTKVLVDATGYSRAVIYPKKQEKPQFLKGTGIEYLIEVEEEDYQKYASSLIFFLGHQWSPKGYSWIFPMDNNQLKVGSAWIDSPHKFIQTVKPLREYTKAILTDYMNLKTYQTIEIHGSILEYASGLSDIYYKNNIIAIGDAVSTVNFLGGEGIRHGMKGAEIAGRYIQDYLECKLEDFRDYQKQMQQIFSSKWNFSEQLNRRVYLEYTDKNIDRGVAALKYLNTEDIIEILFNYKFDKVTRGLRRYLGIKLEVFLKRVKNLLK